MIKNQKFLRDKMKALHLFYKKKKKERKKEKQFEIPVKKLKKKAFVQT